MRKNRLKSGKYVLVDVGNSRTKYALFDTNREESDLSPGIINEESLDSLGSLPHLWVIASVNHARSEKTLRWIEKNRPQDSVRLLLNENVPLPSDVPHPEKVGIDRLLGAFAAWKWKEKQKDPVFFETSLLVCDFGTASTVDFVSSQGFFQGGAILPGFQTAAESLFRGTELIPKIPVIEPKGFPPYPAKDTISAVQSGIFWSQFGVVRQFYETLKNRGERPTVILTGEIAPQIHNAFERECESRVSEIISDLVLRGISCCIVENPDL